MSKPYAPTIGSISEGTLRTEDLLRAFSDELERIAPDCNETAEARAVLTLDSAGWSAICDSEEASELVDALSDKLNEYAPPYTYFGSNEGDGASFGFWPSMDEVDELPRVNDPNEVDAMGEDCVFVNDHGNITVYAADGSVIWDCV